MMHHIQSVKTAETRLINGLMYQVNEQTKTVKRVPETTQFSYNNNISALDAQLSADNTKVLHKFIQAQFPEAKLLNGCVRVNGLKIKYSSHGFKVVDSTGEATNINKFNNDFPTPEAVLKFLTKDHNPTEEPPAIQEIKEPAKPVIPVINREEEQLGKLKKMAATRKLVADEIVKEPSKTRLMVDTAAIINKFISKKLNYRETVSRLKKRLAEPLYKVVMPLFDSFRTNKINQRKFWKDLNAEILKYEQERNAVIEQNRVAAEKRVKPPKFEGVPLWEPVQPKFRTEVHTMKYKDTEEVVNEVTVIDFKTRGASGRLYECSHTIEAYFANVVLHYYPKALALLNKVARGEMHGIDTFKLGKNYVVDPYETHTPALYEHPKDRAEFCRVCHELLAYEGVTTMQDWVYTNEFKKGQKLRICIPMQGIWEAVVLSTEAGVDLRYEDGSTAKLLKNQKVFI